MKVWLPPPSPRPSAPIASRCIVGAAVPGQILVPFVAELTMYGFRPHDSPFPELARILETHDVRNFGRGTSALRISEIRKARWRDRSRTATFGPAERSFSFWVVGLRIC